MAKDDAYQNRMNPEPEKQPIPDLIIPKLPKPRYALGGWPMVIFWLAMLLFAGYASTHMVGAGDTWVALACGRHFVNHGVNTVEPFSANAHRAGPTDEDLKTWPKWITNTFSPDTIRYWHPTGWINQNWLTHVIFYKLVTIFGKPGDPAYDSLVVWKFLMYIATIVVVYYSGRYLGVNPALAATLACFALFVGRSFLDIRPAGFSNLLVGATILILILTTYRSYLYIWLMVPVVAFWSNLHGGYLYAFIAMVPFILLHSVFNIPRKFYKPAYFLMLLGGVIYLAYKFFGFMNSPAANSDKAGEWFFLSAIPFLLLFVYGFTVLWNPERIVKLNVRGIVHVCLAFAAAFAASIVLNPFHLTNLTHTYVISISKHAELWRTINEWHSAWEWDNPVGDEIPFLVMFLLAVTALLIWLIVYTAAKPRPAAVKIAAKNLKAKAAPVAPAPAAVSNGADEFQWPKVDLALIAIGAMTMIMAVESRRFIPIAGIAACPVIALVLYQVICMIAAKIANPGRMKLTLPEIPKGLEKGLITIAASVFVTLSAWWGYNYYKIYMAPWPDDEQYSSVFMRMTASYAKPFCAGAFVRENKLSGKMFNYWTEGGFIAWIQEPNATDGRTPLQLFMDGRAQAAYEPEVFNKWTEIMGGGREGMRAEPDMAEVGKFIDRELKSRDVWIVLMPAAQFETPLIGGLERHPDWRVVFLNNKQEILVDIKSKPGKDVFEKMVEGKLWYPDEFSKELTMARNLLPINSKEAQEAGFESAMRAFVLLPSQMPFLELFGAVKSQDRMAKIDALARKYLDDFDQNQNKYMKQDGFNNKVIAAIIAATYLQRTDDSPIHRDAHNNRLARYRNMQMEIVESSRW